MLKSEMQWVKDVAAGIVSAAIESLRRELDEKLKELAATEKAPKKAPGMRASREE